MSALPELKSSLISMMLSRGDSISIECGLLVIIPNSLLPVPQQWIAENRINLVTEILQQTGQDSLVYLEHTTGKYHNSVASGVTLQFRYLLTDVKNYAIFNANLTRSRDTKHGKAGDPLPAGQFHLEKGASFLKFWKKAGVKKPLSNTEFHKRMGNLKTLLFIADTHETKPGKLINGSIKPNSIPTS